MRFMHFVKGALLLLSFFGSNGYAQTNDSIIEMDEVTVVGERFHHFNTGHFYTTIDTLAKSIQPSVSLSEIISQQSMIQVNSYGAGSSSISARGTGEKRTPIIWNGFNIQSITSAGTDVAQLPSFFFEDMKVQMGGSSALFGSGAAGGMLYLNNKLEFNAKPHVELSSSVGSFNSFSSGTKITFSNSFYSGSLKAYKQGSKNDFPYKATYTTSTSKLLIDTTQTNAYAETYGFMWNNTFKISPVQNIKFNIWYNDNDKNIAPTLSDVAKKKTTDAEQHDKFTAGSVEWSYQHKKMNYWIRSGIFNNKLNYYKPSASMSTFNNSTSSVSEIEASYTPNEYLKFNSGINQSIEFAKATAFEGTKKRNRSALFGSATFAIPQIQFKYSVSGREELIDNETIPVTFSTGLEQILFNVLTIKGNIAKNYRVATFNDLYYKSAAQYGNPDLKPETGMNYEAGLEYAQTIQSTSFSLGTNGFYSSMKDWMNWVQLENKDYTVQNIDKAEIKGFEAYASTSVKTGDFQFHFKGMYTRTDAKDKNTDKFLTNVPKEKTAGSVILKYLNSSIMYQHTWVGKRYANTSNLQEVNAYNIGNIVLSQAFNIKNNSVSLDFGLYNMWNKDYIIIQNYPMQKRNFKLGLRVLL